MLEVLLVALGAAVGAPLRFLTVHLVRVRLGGTGVAGTLVVNVLGSAVLGVVLGASAGERLILLVGLGFCGAYTTFSTFALELWDALRERRIPALVATLVLSLVLGLGAFAVAFAIADRLAG
ncbi:MAG: CrcB family protein [Dermatophilaceae bacterium]|nr:CrcB family protein [Intrasporangiaceae bacterium]